MLFAGGAWRMTHEGRTDYAMLVGLLFLSAVGPGPILIDHHLIKNSADKGRGRL